MSMCVYLWQIPTFEPSCDGKFEQFKGYDHRCGMDDEGCIFISLDSVECDLKPVLL